jgi:hypothetical protein
MLKKLLIGSVMAVALFTEMPVAMAAAPVAANAAVASPQIRVRIGQQRRYPRRYNNRGRWQRNRVGRARLVRQVYWVNGRRYVRYVRVYNRL